MYRAGLGQTHKCTRINRDTQPGALLGTPATTEAEAKWFCNHVIFQQETPKAAFGETDIGYELQKPSTGRGQDARLPHHATQLHFKVVFTG